MPREDDVLAFVRRFQGERGYSPTLREIAEGLGWGGSSTAHRYVDRLVFAGRLRREAGRSRSLVVVEAAPEGMGLDRLGEIKAFYGRPVSCGLDAHEHVFDDVQWLVREVEALRSHEAAERAAGSRRGPLPPRCVSCGGTVLTDGRGNLLGCDRVSCR